MASGGPPAILGTLAAAAVYRNASGNKLFKAILGGLSAAAATAFVRLFSRALLGLQRELFPIEEWIAKYEEDAVDREIAIFDPHHHLWDPRTQPKNWGVPAFVLKLLYSLKPSVACRAFVSDPKNKTAVNTFGHRNPFLVPYMGPELLADHRGNGRGHNVVGTVYLECGWKDVGVEPCMEPVGEVDMVTEVHRQYPGICNGIVAFADLRLGKAVEPALQYYKKNGLVKGIRHPLAVADEQTGIMSSHHATKGMAYDATFREGFALLAKYDLSYDCWLYHEQIPDLADLAHAFPSTTIICDHIGSPLGVGKFSTRKEEVFGIWKESIERLAAEPNVYMKIGGMGMKVLGFGFDLRDVPPTSDELAAVWDPYVTFLIKTFGVDRCMMESNFPVDKISGSFTVQMNAMKKITRRFSKDDRQLLFEYNAKRVYRI